MKSANANISREQRLIRLIKEITSESLIGDDCAVLPGERLISSDMLVEGKHFLLPQMDFGDLGWKSIAVNLSDIAAMAGIPEFVVVNIAMPAKLSDEEFSRLYQSMADCASAYETRIVGGDLTASDRLVISVTVMGKPAASGAFMRSGARAGHVLAVTGDFGASALGLEQILQGCKADASLSHPLKRHLRPEPRLKEAGDLAELCGGCEAALMDASDGLADAVLQIAEASGAGFEIEADLIPVHEETRRIAHELNKDPLEFALYGGEDYELVACVSPDVWSALETRGTFTRIGVAVESPDVLIDTKKETLILDRLKTFQHWSA